ncbi:MAG: carbamoyl-phosphate synthase large subunit [Bacillota bacterium]|nr:carbamoyl-phosphate synthase large subunit [Bacillota bacterium]
MPKRPDVKKVLVLGSGPIVIGQAAEFDYAGSQACLSLREEGVEVVLVNSNPATIMTDSVVADRVYIEPLVPEFIEPVIRRERPTSLLATLGGQVGLNLAVELSESGMLDKYGVHLLGTPLDAIKKAEDRQLFKNMLASIAQPCPPSRVITTLEGALSFAQETGFPLVIRPAFTLGGTGGGFVSNREQLIEVVTKALRISPISQALVETSVRGWKEIEYEVMRDSTGNCITVCNMENIDPMGIHTGDSIVVAPSQTLSQDDYQMLRTASLRIIEALGIEGGCNVQFALDPHSADYHVIEVNPRVSRSSALASKATGYPIARIAAKIACGLTMDEITNPITGKSCACFEPALDYVVLKIPRWPFDKFAAGNRELGTQMKATGEVMAIGRTFESALLKAVRSLESDNDGFTMPGLEQWGTEALLYRVKHADDERLFIIAELLRRQVPEREIVGLSSIDPWFIRKIRNIIDLEETLRAAGPPRGKRPKPEALSSLARAKKMGFSDRDIARLWGVTDDSVRSLRRQGLKPSYEPSYMMVDTCAAEFEAVTPYFYSVYGEPDESLLDPPESASSAPVVVLGSGPIRIGQGIEFDYCCVRAVKAFRAAGVKTIVVNNNPETVSTDFSISDRLYFEPLDIEDVLEVVRREKPRGVVLQFGGQTAINLAGPLAREGVPILGTSFETIDLAEDRRKFDDLLARLGIARPPGGTAHSLDEARDVAARVGYPVLVRPSYVLGGRAMQVVYDEKGLGAYMAGAIRVSREHPVLVDKYIQGKEIEVDAVSDGAGVLIPAVMEHVERAGIHSGDSIAFLPAQSLEPQVIEDVASATISIARALGVIGLLNAQFVMSDGHVYVIEVNPRGSRTVPFVSKVTGIPLVDIAVNIMLGQTLASMGYGTGIAPVPPLVGVKVPVFSWAKLGRVDTALGPEMKSTGEVMGVDIDPTKALYKGLRAAGLVVRTSGKALLTVADRAKQELLPVARMLVAAGLSIIATPGTRAFLAANGIDSEEVSKLVSSDDILRKIVSSEISLVVNTLTRGEDAMSDGFRIRRTAVEHAIPCITSLDTAKALAEAILESGRWESKEVYAVQDYSRSEGSTSDVA